MGSPRCSLEAQAALRRLCRLLDWPDPGYFMDPGKGKKVRTCVKGLDETVAASMGEVEGADFILSLVLDPVNEAPMLALAMRQAWRKGATVVAVDPRPVSLPFEFSHFPMTPRAVDGFARALVREALEGKAAETLQGDARTFYESLPPGPGRDPGLEEEIRALGRKLGNSKRPLIICGTDLAWETTAALASDLAHLLRGPIEGARLFYVLPGPNAFGAGLMSSERPRDSVIDTIESGRIKALMLVEQDPFWLFPDRPRLERALDRLEYLLVLDYLPSPSVMRAHALLPTATLFEGTAVTFVNQEGRLQRVSPVHRGGTPLSMISHVNHPSRNFLDHIPGGDGAPPDGPDLRH